MTPDDARLRVQQALRSWPLYDPGPAVQVMFSGASAADRLLLLETWRLEATGHVREEGQLWMLRHPAADARLVLAADAAVVALAASGFRAEDGARVGPYGEEPDREVMLRTELTSHYAAEVVDAAVTAAEDFVGTFGALCALVASGGGFGVALCEYEMRRWFHHSAGRHISVLARYEAALEAARWIQPAAQLITRQLLADAIAAENYELSAAEHVALANVL